MQHAQNARIKKHIFGQARQEQVMKQRQDSTNAQNASTYGESIAKNWQNIATLFWNYTNFLIFQFFNWLSQPVHNGNDHQRQEQQHKVVDFFADELGFFFHQTAQVGEQKQKEHNAKSQCNIVAGLVVGI